MNANYRNGSGLRDGTGVDGTVEASGVVVLRGSNGCGCQDGHGEDAGELGEQGILTLDMICHHLLKVYLQPLAIP